MKNTQILLPRLMLFILILLLGLVAPWMTGPVMASPSFQEATVTDTVVPVYPTVSVNRPIIVLDSYRVEGGSVSAGKGTELFVKLNNAGKDFAKNIIITFTSTDFILQGTGGVLAEKEMDPGESRRIYQPMTATYGVVGKQVGIVSMDVTYNDNEGVMYSQSFNLTIPITWGPPGTPATPTPTATLPPALRPQLVVTGYQSDVETLQPGTLFHLDLQIQNVGNANARRVTMILGGGTSSGGSGQNPSGTPDAGGQTGGISGGSGDFGSFAPVAASNVQFLGDYEINKSGTARISLIVNASTNPGAYPLKISFAYMGENNVNFTDDQVVTLLVYAPPMVEVNFYRDPGPLFVGQPNQLPLQVVNLGRKATVLGTLKVGGEGAEYQNNTALVGALDTGGYFTLDTMAIPAAPGPLDVLITIDYTDDFNQPQVITRTVSVDVQDMPTMDPGLGVDGGIGPNGEPLGGPGGMPGEGMSGAPETFWQKTVRFLRGLIGLDSSPASSGGEILPEGMPPMESVPGEAVPIPKG